MVEATDTVSEGVPDKLIGALPDIWFDWYARLIPGSLTLGLYLYFSDYKVPAEIKAVPVFVLLASGYVIGHLLQPAAESLVKVAERKHGHEKEYVVAKHDPLVGPSLLNKVSKAHAEAVSMLSCALGLLGNTVWFWYLGHLDLRQKMLAFSVLAYLLFAAYERTSARDRKILDLGILNPEALLGNTQTHSNHKASPADAHKAATSI